MSDKPVVHRRSARTDVDAATDYYEHEAGPDVALRFVDALEATYRAIADRPGTGSSAWGERLRIAGLRHRAVARFPYLVFYVEQSDHIEVQRVLHARRDIPLSLAGPEG